MLSFLIKLPFQNDFFFTSIEQDCNLPNQIKFKIRRGKEMFVMSFSRLILMI